MDRRHDLRRKKLRHPDSCFDRPSPNRKQNAHKQQTLRILRRLPAHLASNLGYAQAVASAAGGKIAELGAEKNAADRC